MTKTKASVDRKVAKILTAVLSRWSFALGKDDETLADKAWNESKDQILALIREVGEEAIGKNETYDLSKSAHEHERTDYENELRKEQRHRLNSLLGEKV